MSSDGERLEISAVCADYFAALHGCDAERFRGMFHPRGVLLGLGPDGAVVRRDSAAFCAGVVARGASNEYAVHDRIVSIEFLGRACASAKVQIALPPAPESPTPTTTAVLYTDFLTLLRDDSIDGGAWRVIAKIYSSAPLDDADVRADGVTPADFSDVTRAVDGYCRSNRRCDGEGMARIFHPACCLTYALPDHLGIVVCDADEFCRVRVAGRWEQPAHRPYAHLRGDPRVAAADTLVSVDFAGPRACRVVLRIGCPPFLWTDVLLCLKLTAPVYGRDGWWIVAKSSSSVPFLQGERGEEGPHRK